MFLKRLEELMKEEGITQYKLSKETLIPATTMEGWKKGQQPSASKILALANYFQVSTDYLLGRENDYGIINIKEAALTREQRNLLNLFCKLSQRGQMKALTYLEGLLDGQDTKENV